MLPSSKYIYSYKSKNKHKYENKHKHEHTVVHNKKKTLTSEEFKLAKELGFSRLDFALAICLKKHIYWKDKQKL